MLGSEENIKTLEQIQKAIEVVDRDRLAQNLSIEQRTLLEESALALRDAERMLIEKTEKELIKQLEGVTKRLDGISKLIREKVKSINQVAKSLDSIEAVIKQIALIGGFAAKLK